MNIIEKMKSFGIGEEFAKVLLRSLAFSAGKPEFKQISSIVARRIRDSGMPIAEAKAFVNSLTVAQLMEAKEA